MTIIQSLPKKVKQIVTDKKFVLNHQKRIDREDKKKHHFVSYFTFDYLLLSKVIKVDLFDTKFLCPTSIIFKLIKNVDE
jgi:hypothetical protein